ncbi:MAG: hypothetical protein ACRD1Y_03500 [Terriglobales bacterium]
MQEELVMAVPAAGLAALGAWQGLLPGGARQLAYIFEPRHSRFLPRAQAEEDPVWKQVIPYVVLLSGDSVFCYRRGQRSSEARLRSLHSIGLGGHIRHSDDSLFAAPGLPAYEAALERELHEEVELGAVVARRRLAGLLNDDSSPVGRVHVGLVHVFELAAPRVRARESKIAAARFIPLDALRGPGAPEMETWSAFCLAGWERLQAEPGWSLPD